MTVKEAVVSNKVGLHARSATYFVQKANEFSSDIRVEVDDCCMNAKSLLGVLSMGIVQGTSVRLIANGSDEKLAVDTLVQVLSGGAEH